MTYEGGLEEQMATEENLEGETEVKVGTGVLKTRWRQ